MNLTAHDVASADGTRLRVWEHGPDDADEAVLFWHGGMTSSKALFAPPLPGEDFWLAFAAEKGQKAYTMYVRGYGESERPPEMDAPRDESGPPARAATAAEDAAAGLSFVRERFDRVHVVGVSWGTMYGGYLLAEEDPEVATLTQCAPVFVPPYDIEDGLAALGLDPADLERAYFKEEKDVVMARQGMDEPTPLFEAVWTTQVESGQGVDGEDAYVAQTGALADLGVGCDGGRVYDPGEIDRPSLVVRASADPTAQRSDAMTLFDELGAAEDRKEYAEVAGGDHFVFHGPRRRALYDVVYRFQQRY